MDTLPELALREDGTLDLNATARRMLEFLVNAVMDAQADGLCEEAGISRNGYRERPLARGFAMPFTRKWELERLPCPASRYNAEITSDENGV